jgi:hypothetical protein
MTSAASARGAFQPGPIPHNVFKQPCLEFDDSEFTDYLGSGSGACCSWATQGQAEHPAA